MLALRLYTWIDTVVVNCKMVASFTALQSFSAYLETGKGFISICKMHIAI